MKDVDKEINCRWCDSAISKKAKYCKYCNQWQNRLHQWISPTAFVSIVGAIAAWFAVYQSTQPLPIVNATSELEAIEHKLRICESRGFVGPNHKDPFCDDEEFLEKFALIKRSVKKIPNIQEREALHERRFAALNEYMRQEKLHK